MKYAKPQVLLTTVAAIAIQHSAKGTQILEMFVPPPGQSTYSNSAAYEADE